MVLRILPLITIPLILLSSVFAVNLANAKRESIEIERGIAARELSAAVDQEFRGLEGILVGFAASPQPSPDGMPGDGLSRGALAGVSRPFAKFCGQAAVAAATSRVRASTGTRVRWIDANRAPDPRSRRDRT